MRLRFFGAVFAATAAAAIAHVTACSLGVSGTGPSAADAGPDNAVEASVDEPAAEVAAEAAPACNGPMCNGACVTDPDCRSCPGAPLFCSLTGQCVSSCQSCSDPSGPMPVECFACDSTHKNPIGTCQSQDAGAYCLSGDYSGQYQGGTGYRCGCQDVSGCPGATQVCIVLGNYDAGFCLTCGESTVGAIQGAACKGGGACQTHAAACQ
jgi:hypothetical protein